MSEYEKAMFLLQLAQTKYLSRIAMQLEHDAMDSHYNTDITLWLSAAVQRECPSLAELARKQSSAP